MKTSIRTMFVVLAIVMSFVTVQGVWAQGGFDCSTVVEGTVSDILDTAIVVGDTTVYGIPVAEWELDIEVGDTVVINCRQSPQPENPKLVACYLTVNGSLIDLRPHSHK